MPTAPDSASTRPRIIDSLALAGWVTVPLLIGTLGAVASLDARSFYTELARPAWAPPGWIFGPVWTVLYAMMGVAAWLVWRDRSERAAGARRLGLGLFVAQLALNGMWSWLFFAWRRGGWAFADIVLLWLAIVAVIGCFARVRASAAWLLAPYLGWVTFASALTWAIWRLNPTLL